MADEKVSFDIKKWGAIIALLLGASTLFSGVQSWLLGPIASQQAVIAEQVGKNTIVSQGVVEIDSRKGFCEDWDFEATEDRKLTPKELFDLRHNCKEQADTFLRLKEKMQ